MADDDIQYDSSQGQQVTRSVGAKMSDAQAKSAAATFRMGTTAGAGLGKVAKSSSGMPTQNPGESPNDFGERLRQWREAKPELEGQKKALQAMGK